LAPFQQEPLGPLQASVTVELQQQQSLTSPSQGVPLVRQAPLVQQVKVETTALTDVKVEKQQLF
jgi:hypothetical protein